MIVWPVYSEYLPREDKEKFANNGQLMSVMGRDGSLQVLSFTSGRIMDPVPLREVLLISEMDSVTAYPR
jgi:hypothetical protein